VIKVDSFLVDNMLKAEILARRRKRPFEYDLALDGLEKRDEAVKLANDALKTFGQIESLHEDRMRLLLAEWQR
jgi:hypothetical protein